MAKEPMEIAHTDSLSDSDQLEVELAALPTNGKVFVLFFFIIEIRVLFSLKKKLSSTCFLLI